VVIGLTVHYGNDASETGRSQVRSGDVRASTGVSEAELRPNLKVERLAAYIKAGIDGTNFEEGEAPTKSKGFRSPHVDVTLVLTKLPYETSKDVPAATTAVWGG
jgi:hypothetical protein